MRFLVFFRSLSCAYYLVVVDAIYPPVTVCLFFHCFLSVWWAFHCSLSKLPSPAMLCNDVHRGGRARVPYAVLVVGVVDATTMMTIAISALTLQFISSIVLLTEFQCRGVNCYYLDMLWFMVTFKIMIPVPVIHFEHFTWFPDRKSCSVWNFVAFASEAYVYREWRGKFIKEETFEMFMINAPHIKLPFVCNSFLRMCSFLRISNKLEFSV